MKALLMAAGRGTRLARAVQYVPKSALPVEGVPLIRRTVSLLKARGIQPAVCVGYGKEMIYQALDGLDVTFYENPFFDVTNSIASLWFMRGELDGETLLMNADVYFEEELLDGIIADRRGAVFMVDRARVENGDYFFKLNKGRIAKYGKEMPLEERSCEYVGIAKVGEDVLPIFKDSMEALIGAQQHGKWWEDAFYSIAHTTPIDTLDVEGRFWAEVDFLDDYERILEYVERRGAGGAFGC